MRLLITAAIAASLIAPISAAAAATQHHHKPVAHHHSRVVRAPSNAPAWYGPTPSAPASMRQPGPPWAGPNQCFEDLGYGRYSPCENTK